jgi:hypothetical protein
MQPKERHAFAKKLGTVVMGLVESRDEAHPGFVSMIATGAAFEGWLAFETRVALERIKSDLGLDERFWIGNEYRKVDLGILQLAVDRATTEDEWWAAVEFKLVYNNKNWKAQCDGIWDDLIPPGGSKKAALKIDPLVRFAFVTVIRAEYTPPSPYQRRADLEERWGMEMKAYLFQESLPDANRVESLWRSSEIPLKDRWLRDPPRVPHTLRFEILSRTEADAKQPRRA